MNKLTGKTLLVQPINEVCVLSIRTSNLLREAGVVTLSQLVNTNTSELRKYKSYGKKSIDELREKLATLGLSLNEEH